MARQRINELELGETVNTIYRVARSDLRNFKNGNFLALRLADATGKIDAILWDEAEGAAKAIAPGDLVNIKGRVGQYQNQPQITVSSLELIEEIEPSEAAEYLLASEFDIEEMYQELIDLAATVEDHDLQRVLQLFWLDRNRQEKFKQAPGGKQWHHAWLGGLLEHTLSLVKLADQTQKLYPQINRDLLLTGAIFHDIGKIDELTFERNFDYSDSGRLLTHTIMSEHIANGYIERVDDFPPEKAMRLRHIILSHHGEAGHAPVVPMTLEALLFHQLDLIDSQVAAYTRELKKAEAEDNTWTNYVRLIERFLYRGDDKVAEV